MSTPRSQNGWTVIREEDTRRWVAAGREFALRKSAAGFVLAHWCWDSGRTAAALSVISLGSLS